MINKLLSAYYREIDYWEAYKIPPSEFFHLLDGKLEDAIYCLRGIRDDLIPEIEITRKELQIKEKELWDREESKKMERRKNARKMRNIVNRKSLLEYGASCKICGSTENLTIDHIKPIIKGGTNEESNLQILCRSCNSRKGTK